MSRVAVSQGTRGKYRWSVRNDETGEFEFSGPPQGFDSREDALAHARQVLVIGPTASVLWRKWLRLRLMKHYGLY